VLTKSITKTASDKNQNEEDLEDSHASSEGKDSLQIREGETPSPLAIKVMPITKCSHVHRKHYAKVRSPSKVKNASLEYVLQLLQEVWQKLKRHEVRSPRPPSVLDGHVLDMLSC
jgi:hypothetical protein